MNLKFENDRKHCALKISWKDFGAWLSRHGASLIRGRKIGWQFWKFGNLICSNHLWVPCLIHINTFVEIRRHTHTTLQQDKDKMSLLQSSSSSRVHCTFCIRLFVVHFAVGKVTMATKTVYCFRQYSSRSSFLREVPDSIIHYYGSRCWYNTVSVEKYCNSFHWIYLLVAKPTKSWRSPTQNRSR